MDPLAILNAARRVVPAVDYALALAGVAAAASLINAFIGNTRASILLMGLVFVGMLLVFVFSRLIVSNTMAIRLAGSILMLSVVLFFVVFLSFTVTAVARGWPCNWADIIQVTSQCTRQEKELGGLTLKGAMEIVEEQLESPIGALTHIDEKLREMNYELEMRGIEGLTDKITSEENERLTQYLKVLRSSFRDLNKRLFGLQIKRRDLLRDGDIAAARALQPQVSLALNDFDALCKNVTAEALSGEEIIVLDVESITQGCRIPPHEFPGATN